MAHSVTNTNPPQDASRPELEPHHAHSNERPTQVAKKAPENSSPN